MAGIKEKLESIGVTLIIVVFFLGSAVLYQFHDEIVSYILLKVNGITGLSIRVRIDGFWYAFILGIVYTVILAIGMAVYWLVKLLVKLLIKLLLKKLN
jgi:hypothetical protein